MKVVAFVEGNLFLAYAYIFGTWCQQLVIFLKHIFV